MASTEEQYEDTVSTGPEPGETNIYGHWFDLGQRIVARHGPVKRLDIHEFGQDLGFRLYATDGTEVRSNELAGPAELTVGYWGTGPRFTKYFLEGAGIIVSLEQIEHWREGDSYTPPPSVDQPPLADE